MSRGNHHGSLAPSPISMLGPTAAIKIISRLIRGQIIEKLGVYGNQGGSEIAHEWKIRFGTCIVAARRRAIVNAWPLPCRSPDAAASTPAQGLRSLLSAPP